jgi:hypothetical protein
MKILIIIVVSFVTGILLGFLAATILHKLPMGGGFSVTSPEGNLQLLFMGFDKGIYGEHHVSILRHKDESSKWRPIFTYLHDAKGLSLREQQNKEITWSNDRKSVKVTYKDRIYGEEVVITFEYNFDSDNWAIIKTSISDSGK